MKNQSGNSRGDLLKNAGKKSKINENSQLPRADIQPTETNLDIAPVPENLNIQAGLAAKEVASTQAVFTGNTAEVFSADSVHAPEAPVLYSGYVQLADASGAVADYIHLADASAGSATDVLMTAPGPGSADTGSAGTGSAVGGSAPEETSSIWPWVAGLAVVGVGAGLAAGGNHGGGDSSSSGSSTPVPTPTVSTPTAALATDSGRSSTDGITNVKTVNVDGLQNGATWEYQVDEGAWTKGSGNTFDLTSGQHNYYVRQTDSAGHVSEISTYTYYYIPSFNEDPTILHGPLSLESSGGHNGITNVSTVTVKGLDTGATWEYQVDGGAWTQGSGTTFDLTTGQHSYEVRETDLAGNVSSPSSSFTFTYDATPPVAPTMVLTVDSGTPGDGITNVAAVNVTGLETGATWQYQVDGGSWTAGSGTSFNLTSGAHDYAVRQIDEAGNVSGLLSNTFTLDTTPPVAPTMALAVDSGTPGDGITNVATVNVAGMEAGATWQYQVDGGSWTAGSGASFNLTEGAHNYSARQTDAVGNVSGVSSNTFTLETTPPPVPPPPSDTTPPPVAPTMALAVDSGTPGDGITNVAPVDVANLEAGATWQYQVDGGSWTAGSGTSFNLTEGAHNDSVRQMDAAGNVSGVSSNAFTLDTTFPGTPLITGITGDSGTVGDHITNDNTLVISGTADAGATVQVNVDGVLKGTALADGSGNWTFDYRGTTLADNTYHIAAKVTDVAGNPATSADYAVKVDTTPPTVAISTDDMNLALNQAANITFTFSEDPGTSFVQSDVTVSGGTLGVISGTGLSRTAVFTPADGSTTNSVISVGSNAFTDAAGNANADGADADNTLTMTVRTMHPSNLTLSSIAAGTGGFVINGAGVSDKSGYSVSSAGDVNGDGLGDLIVGAPAISAAGKSGNSYVVFGKADTGEVDLSAVTAGTGGFVIGGLPSGSMTGCSVSSAGDVNGDGYADLIVGAKGTGTGGILDGGSYVVFGKAGMESVTLSTTSAPSYVDSHGATVSDGFALAKVHIGINSNVGYSVSGAGDFNGDGLADLIVGSDGNGSNRAFLVYGKTSSETVNLDLVGMTYVDAGGATKTGGVVISDLGNSIAVSTAGDVNGDGLGDLIVSNPYWNTNGNSYVVFGTTDTSNIDMINIASYEIGGFSIEGPSGDRYDGWSVSGAGDVNGDGLADLIVGSNAPTSSYGKSYVVFGKTDTSEVHLGVVAAGTGGFLINNGTGAADMSGYNVSSAGDVNGDGLADLIVGAYKADPNGIADSGASYVVYGKTGTEQVTLNASGPTYVDAGGTTRIAGYVINGSGASDYSGYSVSAAGDVNGDGLADLIVGAYQADPKGLSNAGASYVIFGGMQQATAVDYLGTSGDDTYTGSKYSETIVTGAGNDTITGNGGSDVMYGASGNDTFIINADNVAKLSAGVTGNNYARIDGGSGIDTIKLDGSGVMFDLTAIADQGAANPDGGSRISSIEKIDISGSGNNTLRVAPSDVIGMSEMNVFNAGNGWTGLGTQVDKHQLVIDGNAGDIVQLAKDPNLAGWTYSGSDATYGAQHYRIYNATDGTHAQLLINTDITVQHSLSVKMSDTALIYNDTAVETATVTFTFSDTPTSFGMGNISYDQNSGTLTNLAATGNPRVWTATFTPKENTYDAANAITVHDYVDAAGNVGETVTGPNYTIDTKNVYVSALGSRGFVINGTSHGDGGATRVSYGGDINGDGLDDLIVSVPFRAPNSIPSAGETYVVFGKTDSNPVNLTSLMSTNPAINPNKGFVMNGISSGDYLGIDSVSAAGDVNGDGLADILVNAQKPNNGTSFLVFGKTDTGTLNLSTVAAGSGGFVINGVGESDWAGHGLSAGGDVNGDGLADLLVGAYGADPNGVSSAGSSYVIFGKQDTGAVNLSAIAAGSGGFIINGSATSDYSGYSLSGAGDVNGDGLADIIVGAHKTATNGTESGSAYVVFGQTGNNTVNLGSSAVTFAGSGAANGFVINDVLSGQRFGYDVSGAGDINGDGLADLVVGAPYANSYTGGSYVIFGKTSSEAVSVGGSSAPTYIDANGATIACGFAIVNGSGLTNQSGISISGVGDVNGDGLADFLVGDSEAHPVLPTAFMVYGKTGTETVTLNASGPTYVDAGGNTVECGYNIVGAMSGDLTGKEVSAAGDVNGDGFADLIVGAPYADTIGYVNNGAAYVIFGGAKPTTTAVDILGTSGTPTLTGTTASETIIAGGPVAHTITGNGGADIIYGGAGNDTIVINADNVAKLSSGVTDGNYARIDGGNGIDTINLYGSGIVFDLSKIANQSASNPGDFSRIESIERINLNGSSNSLNISINDVLDMSEMNVFHNGTFGTTELGASVDRYQVVVDGVAGNSVTLTGDWNHTSVKTVTDSGHAYSVYDATASHAEILIDQHVSVAFA
ncbi:MAG: hypothetical protein CSYNP_00434 [Syntrophus sp. SKADARSKE-3]|nr:hypothetical protein [Syntrophus sp. SKADARSKE-3]